MISNNNPRDKYVTTRTGKKTLNLYWEGLLDEEQTWLLKGYDTAAEQSDASMEAFKNQALDEEKIKALGRIEYDVLDAYQESLHTSLEIDRADLIITMIEMIDDDEYKKRYRQAYMDALIEEPDLYNCLDALEDSEEK